MLTTLVGLIGIVIGAWLNALLTTRRERWNLRRDLYTRLLENLGEAKAAQGSLWDLEVNDRHSDIESVVNYRKNRIEELSKRDEKLRTHVGLGPEGPSPGPAPPESGAAAS